MELSDQVEVRDQASKLRHMMRARRAHARVIAVTSGKGGVGKTNIAANLAVCLSATGKRTVLLDADLGLANVDVVFDLQPRRNLWHVIEQGCALEEAMVEGPGGVQVMCGASGIARLANLSEFERQNLLESLTLIEQMADVVVIDTAAGISRNVLCFTGAADHTVVLATPEPTAITDAYAMVKLISRDKPSGHLSLLVNMVSSRSEARTVQQRISSVARRFLDVTVYDAGYVLRDEHVAASVRRREPFVLAYPRCQASYCVGNLAAKIARGVGEVRQQHGFFRRVANWFY